MFYIFIGMVINQLIYYRCICFFVCYIPILYTIHSFLKIEEKNAWSRWRHR